MADLCCHIIINLGAKGLKRQPWGEGARVFTTKDSAQLDWPVGTSLTAFSSECWLLPVFLFPGHVPQHQLLRVFLSLSHGPGDTGNSESSGG